jgi:ATP-dependent DNA helicase PIF1
MTSASASASASASSKQPVPLLEKDQKEKDQKEKKTWALDQERAIRQFLIAKKSLFLSGEGGTGKSTLLHHIIGILQRKWPKDELAVAVTATSSQAALNLKGSTIHSWAGLKICQETASVICTNIINQHLNRVKKRKKSGGKRKDQDQEETTTKNQDFGDLPIDGFLTRKTSTAYSRILCAKVLIIDEISTFSGSQIALLDDVLRNIRSNPDVPFGGIQILLSGDFAQLPPVEPELALEAQSDYAFLYRDWKTAIQSTVLLRTVFRQKDQTFVDLLQRMREGAMTDEDHKKMMLRVSDTIPLDDFQLPILQLHPLVRRVNEINQTTLAKLHTQLYSFTTEYSYVNQRHAINDFASFPPYAMRLARELMQQYKFQEILHVKVGASIMLTTNMTQHMRDPRLCNSLRGYIVAIGSQLESSEFFKLAPTTSSSSSSSVFPDWTQRLQTLLKGGLKKKDKEQENEKSKLDLTSNAKETASESESESNEEKEIVVWVKFSGIEEIIGMRVHQVKEALLNEEKHLDPGLWTSYVCVYQFPFMLAWAATIHKVQGCEYETLYVHFREYMRINQTYTAISRVKSVDKLFLNYWDSKLVRVDPHVVKQIGRWIKIQPSFESMQKFFAEHPTPLEYL